MTVHPNRSPSCTGTDARDDSDHRTPLPPSVGTTSRSSAKCLQEAPRGFSADRRESPRPMDYMKGHHLDPSLDHSVRCSNATSGFEGGRCSYCVCPVLTFCAHHAFFSDMAELQAVFLIPHSRRSELIMSVKLSWSTGSVHSHVRGQILRRALALMAMVKEPQNEHGHHHCRSRCGRNHSGIAP